MKRAFDIMLSVVLLTLLIFPILIIGLLVKLSSVGPVFYWSRRSGKDNQFFEMPKFRTMMQGAPPVATHLLKKPDLFLTPVGGFLRRSSLDEIPQLFSILKGDMSFVGPRPALFNQKNLIEQRTKKGVHKFKPGLTGWAQVNGRDNLPLHTKVKFDEYYVKNQSLLFDIRIMFLTFPCIFRGQGIWH